MKGACKGLINPTWTPKVCRMIAFYRCWAIILPTLGGLGTSRVVRSRASQSIGFSKEKGGLLKSVR